MVRSGGQDRQSVSYAKSIMRIEKKCNERLVRNHKFQIPIGKVTKYSLREEALGSILRSVIGIYPIFFS